VSQLNGYLSDPALKEHYILAWGNAPGEDLATGFGPTPAARRIEESGRSGTCPRKSIPEIVGWEIRDIQKKLKN